MKIRSYLRRLNSFAGIKADLEILKTEFIKKRRAIILIDNYLSSHKIRKLQLGSGPTRLPGWLETDIKANPDFTYLNVTERFPFEDNTIDYIFTEHVIEHLSWKDGIFMLKECRRVLKPNGIIRIATPDLEVFLKLYFDSNDVGMKYIKWITDRDLAGVNKYKASFVINNLFRNYGHKFLYDGDLLTSALEIAGFKNIQMVEITQSKDENLRGLESHGKDIGSNEMAEFETMVFEATKEFISKAP